MRYINIIAATTLQKKNNVFWYVLKHWFALELNHLAGRAYRSLFLTSTFVYQYQDSPLVLHLAESHQHTHSFLVYTRVNAWRNFSF